MVWDAGYRFDRIAWPDDMGYKNTTFFSPEMYRTLLKLSLIHICRGERQRVALASVLALQTPVLVLDEPTTGQDYRECIEIMEIVRQQNESGTTVIMVSHDMELVSDYAKRVILLCEGSCLVYTSAI